MSQNFVFEDARNLGGLFCCCFVLFFCGTFLLSEFIWEQPQRQRRPQRVQGCSETLTKTLDPCLEENANTQIRSNSPHKDWVNS